MNVSAPVIQAKLSINQPNDIYEQEADAIADKVVHAAEQSTNGKSATVNSKNISLQRKCKECEDEEKKAQRKSASVNTTPVSASNGIISNNGISNRINSLQGRGNTMDNQTQAFMSGGFGVDFGNVQIHTDDNAADLSRQLGARAFTVGNDIYFNTGEYKPSSEQGKHLLAHELTHTIQQSGKQLRVQKDDKEKPEDNKPSVDFDALPPDLKIRFWHLLFEANTSQVKLDLETKSLKPSLSYKYGGALTLSLKGGGTTGSFGWQPGDNKLSLGLSHGPVGANFSATPGQDKYSLGLRLGDKLLPPPSDMGRTFMAGGSSAGSMLTGLPGGLDDPLAYYKAHKDDIENVSKSVDLAKDITEAGKKRIRFGADFSLSYDPVNSLVFTARAGLMYNF
ncbi:DUF4157 domain-containing protein [Danxiaibacter flavus]|uniref:DUF4157 domain-containing protein n=1 Tax=Danxiaibacter flavus TaxID=3049108 RepID=A0ABV3ZGE2_9BACT|nr:DUF4157 domain-containing protein [Chitinophagaceae bacterium DXS]